MRTQKRHWSMRVTALTAMLTTGGLPLAFTGAQAETMKARNALIHPPIVRTLAPGLTQTPDAATRKKIDAKEAAAHRAPDVRSLSFTEMKAAHGRGPNRNPYYGGSLPWHRNIHDVDLCTGNLFKSFTDVQVSPARGAGLVLQRTYNSNDARIGPFGIGWTHAYDIRIEEAGSNLVPRTDFFGAKHTYHRDADGLYSPPAYLYDELDSNYNAAIVNGPFNIADDIDKGMDGTIKHFIPNGSERVCDYIQDRYGNRTTLAYSLTVTLGDGSTKNLLTQVTDPSARTLVFTWANLGTAPSPAWRITRVDGPQYGVVYAYNNELNLQSATLDVGDNTHLNRAVTYGYTSVSGPNGIASGLLSSITDPLGHIVTYGYTISTPTNTVWVNQIGEPGGVDANNSPRVFTWAVNIGVSGNTIYAGAESEIGKVYIDSDSNLRKIDSAFTSAGDFYTTYDSANNVLQAYHEPSGSAEPLIVEVLATKDDFTYGPHGNPLTHTQQGAVVTGDSTSYFDGSQYFQKCTVTDAMGHTSRLGVGSNTAGNAGDADANPGDRGSVLWAKDAKYGDGTQNNSGTRFQYAYNAAGQKVQETNQNGVVTRYTYGDPWGNLTSVVQDPTPTPADGQTHLNRVTSMTYDVAGHVLTSTDPMGRQSTFSYNALGQPMSVTSPATPTSPAETITYSYGINGRTESVTDHRGTTTITYEPGCDRVHSVTDPVTGTVSYTYGVSGERQSMTLPGGGTWTYGYLPAPQPTCAAKDDPNGLSRRLASITDDQGRQVAYGIDNDGRLRNVTFDQTYTTGSNPTLVRYCQTMYSYGNSQVEMFVHGWLMQVTTLRWTLGQNNQWQSTPLVSNAYTYDLAGQRLSNQISSVDPVTGNPVSRTELYGYDAINRLTNVDYGDGQTQSYTFDPMGNRMSKTDAGGGINGPEAYTYNAANMLLSRGSNAYTNDADGNTLTGGGRTNTWDSQNRLVTCVNGATTSNFVYGADGIRRQATIVNGASTTVTDSVLDNSMLVREQRAGSNFATYFVGARGPEYRRDDTRMDASSGLLGVTSWYLYDGLGSVIGEVDPNGNITSSRKYDVYGLVRGGNNPAGTSGQKFVGSLGHASEDNTGLIYMRARYMDPVTGRFISQDPSLQGKNWFSYCANNPVNRFDSSGRMEEIVEIILISMSHYLSDIGTTESAADVLQVLYINLGRLSKIAKFAKFMGEEKLEGATMSETGALLGPDGAELEERIAEIEKGLAEKTMTTGVAAALGARMIEDMIEIVQDILIN